MGITLLKAAEILGLNVKEAGPKMPADCKEAVTLGAEALQRLDYHRKAGHIFAQQLLPSEIAGPEK
jgi:hypothetical protein